MKVPLNPRLIALGLIMIGLGASLYAISLPLRASAQKAGCQSNLKQIGLATMQYVRDYDELFMLAPKWKEELEPYGKFYRKPNFAPVYICPTTSLEYSFNEAMSGSPITLVKSPKNMAMFYEPSRPVTTDRGKSWNPDGVHGNGSNVCFQDGHVAWVQTKPTFWVTQLAKKESLRRRRDQEWQRNIVENQRLIRRGIAQLNAARLEENKHPQKHLARKP